MTCARVRRLASVLYAMGSQIVVPIPDRNVCDWVRSKRDRGAYTARTTCSGARAAMIRLVRCRSRVGDLRTLAAMGSFCRGRAPLSARRRAPMAVGTGTDTDGHRLKLLLDRLEEAPDLVREVIRRHHAGAGKPAVHLRLPCGIVTYACAPGGESGCTGRFLSGARHCLGNWHGRLRTERLHCSHKEHLT